LRVALQRLEALGARPSAAQARKLLERVAAGPAG
jgi:hypothetical protein